MSINKKVFGKTRDGQIVDAYCITNKKGHHITAITYGCTITEILVKDRDGKLQDVCLGYDTVADYEEDNCYMGACIGRHSNRIGGGRFLLGGQVYTLNKNDGENHLHGGVRGFDKYVWNAEIQEDKLIFSRLSPDGEEGYPGNLRVQVIYEFTDEDELKLTYEAESDKDTVVNMTNHSYFNLSGLSSDDAMDHFLWMNASAITENDKNTLPDGKMMAVENTPFDFRQAKPVGQDIHAEHDQLKWADGYDCNYVIDGKCMEAAAKAVSPVTGISMEVMTDLPGIQLYSGNFLNGRKGKGGRCHRGRCGFCLETQYFPNAMACENFVSPVLLAGEKYRHQTVYRFGIEE